MALETTGKEERLGRVGRGFVGEVLLGRLGWTLVSFLVLLGVWLVVAAVLQSRLFPGPMDVLATLSREAATGALFHHVGVTLARVAAAFVVAMAIGSAIGIALGASRSADRFFDTWLIFFLNLPALVTIILCYVWFGLTELAAIVAVSVNKIPNVAVTVREGARSLSRDLTEMAAVYRLGWWKTLRHVTVPQLAPFFAAAARGGLALVWKIVLVVELLGRSDGVGHQLHIAFQLFDVSMILAYAIAFILVVQAIELGVLQPIEAHVNRWRR
ncbi:MAG: ABC transporter permease subunit [Hyphomicrobiaceae bacterium]|nr:ABC transporter permease subunit [Hyphomicrobiaceae bacterium]